MFRNALAATTIMALISSACASAQTLQIERTFTFDNYSYHYSDYLGRTSYMDTYVIDPTPLVVTPGTYDAIEVTFRPAGGGRVVVRDVSTNMYMSAELGWLTPTNTDSFPGTNYTLQFINGTGALPGPDNPGAVGISPHGTWISAYDQFTGSSGAYAFDAFIMRATFSPVAAGGTYTQIRDNQIVFGYGVDGQAPDNGRLTQVVPLPAAIWAGLPLLGGLSGISLLRRRR